jgi:glycosyltransferase involved in cell wall biosynthesis
VRLELNQEIQRGSRVPADDLAPRLIVVVCPTEYGGHIEHAAELASAFHRVCPTARVVLLTRPGAAEAVESWSDSFELRETLAPRRTRGGLGARVGQMVDLTRDRVELQRTARESVGQVLVVLETPKYGVISRPRGTNVLFVHNAVPHEAGRMSVRDRVMHTLERWSARRADRVMVHGDRQREIVRRWTDSDVRAVSLPGDTRAIQRPEQGSSASMICLGEVRRNKGVEVAIQAASRAGVALTIAGRPESPEYGRELAALPRAESVELRLGFLPSHAFSSLLEQSRVVVMPYTQFAAQSGILARSMQLGKQVVVTDLPSLREQVGGYRNSMIVPVGDVDALAEAMRKASLVAQPVPTSDPSQTARREWDDVIHAILG